MDLRINTPQTTFGLKLLNTKELKQVSKLAQKQGKQEHFNNAVNLLKSSPVEGDVLVIARKPNYKTDVKSYSNICVVTPDKQIKSDRKVSQTIKNPIETALNHFLEINNKNSNLFKTLFS